MNHSVFDETLILMSYSANGFPTFAPTFAEVFDFCPFVCQFDSPVVFSSTAKVLDTQFHGVAGRNRGRLRVN